MRNPLKRKLRSFITVIVAVVLLGVYLYNYTDLFSDFKNKQSQIVEGKCVVTYIDVGQGDSTLISCGSKNILIDAGENNMGDEVIAKLKSLGVNHLDYVIGTHAHSDHIGGLDTVISSIETENIILCDLPEKLIPDTKTYTDLLSAISSNDVNLIAAEPKKSFDIGEGKLTILGPTKEYSDQNNMSIVARFDFGETSFLFTGDAETKPEGDLVSSGAQLDADVLKVGHHGSNTSSSKKFIQAVSPDYAIIEVGAGNEYNHPSDDTIDTLNQIGAEVYRTDLNGCITVTTDGKEITLETERK